MEKLCYERRSYAYLKFYIRNNMEEAEQKLSLRAAVGSLNNKGYSKRLLRAKNSSPIDQSLGVGQNNQEFDAKAEIVDQLKK